MKPDHEPRAATHIISFGEANGDPAKITFNVPLPGYQTGRRFVRLNLGLGDSDWKQAAKEAGEDLVATLKLRRRDDGSTYAFDPVAAAELFRRKLYESGATPTELAPIDEAIAVLRLAAIDGALGSGRDARETILRVTPARILARTGSSQGTVKQASAGAVTRRRMDGPPPRDDRGDDRGDAPPSVPPPGSVSHPAPGPTSPAPDQPPPLIPQLRDLFAALEMGVFLLPRKSWTGTIELVPIRPAAVPDPTLFLVEVHAITSSPGDYGLGRTVRTFSLFPGESTEITVRNWRTTREQTTASSTIMDSFSREAADRFSSQLNTEQSDSILDDTVDKFSWDAHAGGGIDLGFFSLGGGGGASETTENHSARQQSTKQVTNTLVEHTNQANDSRQITVSSTAERVEETGEEVTTVRTIRNVNMRRTLNFVFRELNQEFRTRIHLIDLRLGFDNGRAGSWRETSLAGLLPFLHAMLKASAVDRVIRRILKLASVVFDDQDRPVNVLETVRFDASGQSYQIRNADLNRQTNEYAEPTETFFYRFKRGNLGQQGADPVDGVVLSDATVVLRTDGLVVEALLGQADALDSYAMQKQAADAEAALLENERHRVALEALRGISDPKERATAYAAIFKPKIIEDRFVVLEEDKAKTRERNP